MRNPLPDVMAWIGRKRSAEQGLDRPSLLKEASTGCSNPEALIKLYEKKVAIDYRTHYNLACYKARAVNGETSTEQQTLLTEALMHLEFALEADDQLVAWAASDPSLRRLMKERASEFLDLVNKYAAPPKRSTLASLHAIGEHFAQRLATHGIVTPDELVRQGFTTADRKALAARLQLALPTVERWVYLADLLRIIDIDGANLLDAAQLASISKLAAQDPDALTRQLRDVQTAFGLTRRALNLETVEEWIKAAKREGSQVEEG